jgi:hypothetical protein
MIERTLAVVVPPSSSMIRRILGFSVVAGGVLTGTTTSALCGCSSAMEGAIFSLDQSLCGERPAGLTREGEFTAYICTSLRIPSCTICTLNRVCMEVVILSAIKEVYNDAIGLRRLRACLLACLLASVVV